MHDLHYSTDGFVLFCLVLLHPHIKTTKDCRMSAFLFFLLTFLCWTSNIPWTSLLDFLMERRLLLKTRRVENLTVGIFEKVSAFYAVVSSRKTNTLFMTLSHMLNNQQNNGCYSADFSSFFLSGSALAEGSVKPLVFPAR